MAEFFTGTTPCGNCPYRKDATLQHWSVDEFKDLLASDVDLLGKTYECHKNNGTVCRGWLMNQDKRGFPSIKLRMALANQPEGIRIYLDKLRCKTPMFETIMEMCVANYPEVFEIRKCLICSEPLPDDLEDYCNECRNAF